MGIDLGGIVKSVAGIAGEVVAELVSSSNDVSEGGAYTGNIKWTLSDGHILASNEGYEDASLTFTRTHEDLGGAVSTAIVELPWSGSGSVYEVGPDLDAFMGGTLAVANSTRSPLGTDAEPMNVLTFANAQMALGVKALLAEGITVEFAYEPVDPVGHYTLRVDADEPIFPLRISGSAMDSTNWQFRFGEEFDSSHSPPYVVGLPKGTRFANGSLSNVLLEIDVPRALYQKIVARHRDGTRCSGDQDGGQAGDQAGGRGGRRPRRKGLGRRRRQAG